MQRKGKKEIRGQRNTAPGEFQPEGVAVTWKTVTASLPAGSGLSGATVHEFSAPLPHPRTKGQLLGVGGQSILGAELAGAPAFLLLLSPEPRGPGRAFSLLSILASACEVRGCEGLPAPSGGAAGSLAGRPPSSAVVVVPHPTWQELTSCEQQRREDWGPGSPGWW